MPTSWRDKSFEQLPALSVRGPALRSSLRLVTIAWMFGVVWMSCITGSQMTTFGRLLGFADHHFGLMAAIPYAATFAQIIAAAIIERTGLRKYMFIFNASIHRMLWLAMATVPLLLPPGPAAVATFLALFGLSVLLAHLSSPPWQTWMGDLIPRRIRGRFFANRSRWTVPIQMIVAIAAGLLLDAVTAKGAPLDAAHQPTLLWSICGLFAVGAIFGTIDVLLFRRMREIVTPPLVQRPASRGALQEFGDMMGSVFRDRVLRNYALFGAVVAFSLTVSDQYFWLNALERVGFGKLGANIVFMVCGAISFVLVVGLWGRLIDRWGRRPVLIAGTAGTILSPIGWFFIPEGNLPLAYAIAVASCLIGGLTWSAVNLAQVGIVMGFSETTGRSRYIAAAAVVAAVGGFLGGLAGAGLVRAFHFLLADPIAVGPFRWNTYHVTFAVSMAARASAILFLIGMPDPGARPLRQMMRSVWFHAYGNTVNRLFWALRSAALRRRLRRRAPRPADAEGPNPSGPR